MLSALLCEHKNIFQSLDKSDYQRPQYEPMCQVRNTFFGEQKISLLLKFGLGIYFFEETKNQIGMFLEMCIVQFTQTKSVLTFQPTEISIFTTIKIAKPALTR